MNTAQLVRLCLAHHRAQGAPFEVAWMRAMQSIPRGPNGVVKADRAAWVVALRWARPEFQAAYELRERDAPLTPEHLQLAEPRELEMVS